MIHAHTSLSRAGAPKDTPYEGGTYVIDITIPPQYPMVPPTARFRTKIFHPNVHFKVRASPRLGQATGAGWR